jgi:outer membrane protein assembly factor BamD (BamD/ComL family)
MITAYRKLGLDELANDTTRILKLNFPGQASDLLTVSD